MQGSSDVHICRRPLYSPIITTPINLDYTLKLDNGRSYVGLTAATGESMWQAHDILSWEFSSTYEDEEYNPPIIVNGEERMPVLMKVYVYTFQNTTIICKNNVDNKVCHFRRSGILHILVCIRHLPIGCPNNHVKVLTHVSELLGPNYRYVVLGYDHLLYEHIWCYTHFSLVSHEVTIASVHFVHAINFCIGDTLYYQYPGYLSRVDR